MQMPARNVRIGDLLVEHGFINEKQLQDALNKQKESNGKMIGEIILEMGLVSETQLAQALSIRLKVPFVDLAAVKINTEAVMKIPEEIAREKTVLAFDINNNRLLVATNDPINFYIFEDLKVRTGMDIIPQISTKTAIEEAIGKFYASQAVDNAVDELANERMAEANAAEAESSERIDNAPIVKLVNMMVETAFRMQVTDIAVQDQNEDTLQDGRRVGGAGHEGAHLFPQFHNYPYQDSRRNEYRGKKNTA